MNKDWLILVQKFDVESARIKFENICEGLFRKLNPTKTVRTVRVNHGDGGIDVFVGEIGEEPIDVIQCKFFVNGIEESQQNQIRESFKKAIGSNEFETKSWTLCIVNILDLQQNKWWSSWKKKNEENYQLPSNFISLKDGNAIIDLIKEHNLYNTSFELEDSLKIDEIHQKLVRENSQIDIGSILKSTSYALLQVRNYIEDKTNAHIVRSEVTSIYNWIIQDLPSNQKNVLILKGEKGLGKSAILKDLYEKLSIEKYNVLGLKADKFYCKSIVELETKLFDNLLSFDKLIKETVGKREKLIVIIDQIDAMSLTLSSSREYIETYNKLISKLQTYQNVRIIISSRSYDLKYDSELSIYNSDSYKKILVNLFSEEEVKSILTTFNIKHPSQKVLHLLKTPNHLDIFCRIYDSNSKREIDSISTLKDLYDHLWKKYISPRKEFKLKELIYKIVQRMYQEQRISVGNIYEDDYFSEIGYLSSNSILIEYDKEIQFFHQTFYEYAFAKHFVDNDRNLESYIIENEQSLYVRSITKMIVEYLRESDIQKYINTIKNILISDKYRFHIKSLIISLLGGIKNPCELEKKFALEVLFENDDYENVFISSIHSFGWVNFFISENIPSNYFSKTKIGTETEEEYKFRKKKYSDYNWSVFVNNINESPTKLIDHLELLNFENKEFFIPNLLFYINDWSDADLIPYFEKYIPFQKESEGKRDNHYFYEVLRKIFPHNKEFAYGMLGTAVADFYDKFEFNYRFEHSLNEIVKDFCKTAPLESFKYLFSIYKEIVDKTKTPYLYYGKIESPLYKSSKINDKDTHQIYSGKRGLEDYLEVFILNSNTTFFLEFYQNYKNSDDTLLLKMIIKKLDFNYSFYRNEILELIEILTYKNIFGGSDDDLQLQLRILISNVYKLLEKEQREFIDNILLDLRTTYDYWIWKDENGKRRISLNEFGKKKYLFIKALPFDELIKNKLLFKTYKELNRKFGDLNPKIATDTSGATWSSVSPPLSESACRKMTLKHWKKSMIKYNENYKSDRWAFGNIEEHSKVFQNIVKENPSKFYEFIEGLFNDKQISEKYILRGVGGLIDGNYNPNKVKKLFKQLITLDIINSYYGSIVNHYIGYFIENKNIDKDIVLYLSDLALNYPTKDKEHNPNYPLHDAVNSVVGSALSELIHCFYNKEFEEIIFSTIEKLIEKPCCNDSVKIMILNDLVHLNRLNIISAFKIFSKLTDTSDSKILKHSINPSQYFNNRFHDEMDCYFERVFECPEIYKQNYVLISSWILGLDNEKKWYNKFIEKGKDAKLCAIDVAENFLIDEDTGVINVKALEILSEFLSETDKEFAGEYSCVILRKFKPENFQYFFPFLNEYSKTVLCRKDPRYFLQYLSTCSKNYPEKCLELLEKIDFRDKPDIQDSGHYDKEPIQLILAIYSKLVSEVIKNKTLINQSLDIFDGMLKHRHLRNNANQAIETIQ
ncbi:AAA family ATPase [Kaistella flava (ex Peng et al. 2021)]|uniref:AAA family ATPase n=1 Tax=Kaistella flava (ex Peng et al. 2021) TaxID=2038776 RepID=A0A7M2Y8G1_9FLAO|nr:ATP-binding protein [Kaistella flava (ex Peng et al. 2021)]QOW09925.1 AAA family ATPase [Kaistella flava (ex Peng et al. 2021)]